MASLHHLWSNRTKYPVDSTSFYKAWGKRIFALPELVRRNQRRWQLMRRGAVIHDTAEIGRMRVTGHKRNLKIGPHSFIGQACIALHEKVIIGERVCINDGVQIFTASHDVLDPKWSHVTGTVVIEDYVWIGTGAMILPGVQLGHGSVVGAGAVVTKSVPPRTIVAGNPAKRLTKMRSSFLNYNPCEFLASNHAWLNG